jgi:hypothetical protein
MEGFFAGTGLWAGPLFSVRKGGSMNSVRLRKAALRILSIFLAACSVEARTQGGQVYSQPFNPSGGQYLSSWFDPNGSDNDQYVWDDFTLPVAAAIAEIDWTGAYDPSKSGSGGKALDFSVAVYPSIAGGSQPDMAHGALVRYQTNGNANESAADSTGGIRYYSYSFVLPAPFAAAANTKYWLQIEAVQHGIPDWGIAAATGGDNTYYRKIANAGDIFYQAVPGDAAFSLLGQSVSATGLAESSMATRRHRSASQVFIMPPLSGRISVYPVGQSVCARDFLGRKVSSSTIVGSPGNLSTQAIIVKMTGN